MKRLLKFFVEKNLRYSRYFKKELKNVNRRRAWKAAWVQQRQSSLLVELVHTAYHNSPFYRRFYDAHRVAISKIKSRADIQRLPVVTSEHIKQNPDDFFIGNRLNKIKASTSGTTGSPMTLYRDYQSVAREGAYMWSHRAAFGYTLGMKTVTLRGNLGKDQMEFFDPFTNTLYLSSYNLSPDNAEWYYDRIKKFNPHVILAYPSSLEILANYFRAMDKSLHIPLSFTSSETVYSHQREKIEQVFKTKVVDWYGNAERTIALEQSKEGFYDEPPLYSINEFYDNHALTTGFINFSFPLIRYRVDDVFLWEPDAKGTNKIKSIQGRSYDYLELPDGTRIGLMCCAMKGIDHLQFAQIVQKDSQKFVVNVVAGEEFTRADEQHLKNNIIKRVGTQAPFDIVHIREEQIIRAKSGKFKLINNLSNRAKTQQEQYC